MVTIAFNLPGHVPHPSSCWQVFYFTAVTTTHTVLCIVNDIMCSTFSSNICSYSAIFIYQCHKLSNCYLAENIETNVLTKYKLRFHEIIVLYHVGHLMEKFSVAYYKVNFCIYYCGKQPVENCCKLFYNPDPTNVRLIT